MASVSGSSTDSYVTSPRVALKEVDSLFEEIVIRFLRDVGPAAVSYRRRREVRDLAARAVKEALRRRSVADDGRVVVRVQAAKMSEGVALADRYSC